MIPKWIRVVYKYVLSGYEDLRADNLEVYTDCDGEHWIQPRNLHHACVDEYPSLQEFIDSLQEKQWERNSVGLECQSFKLEAVGSSPTAPTTNRKEKKMKFDECGDVEMLRRFAKFLMGIITELYKSVDEAWEDFLYWDNKDDRTVQR